MAGHDPAAARPIVGTAGWAIPKGSAQRFPAEGSSLQRYSARFTAAEVNSSFHRPHRRSTWERWACTVPESFRFSVKLPKLISHERKLADCEEPLRAFLDQASALDEALAAAFFRLVRASTKARLVCEPRHPSWFSDAADSLLTAHEVARAAADPAIVPQAAQPGGWPGLTYVRLHGSPRTYYSSYDAGQLRRVADLLVDGQRPDRPAWCIFDNTASGAATGDALALLDALSPALPPGL